ncbi:hypothetical protein FWG76_01210, partial [Candidatus Saccharibacteria bacterium]|nr:hypothetical protein [Candidatus Saccharibacteria bacterium]
ASMILVPVASGGSNTIAAASVAQTNDQLQNNPFPINCITPVGGAYACSVTITLPDPINNTTRHDGTAFLILESIYLVGTHDFQVRVQRDGAAVPLVGVQVAVDSTGRNADSLRRIEGRIEVVDTAYPYPEWTVQLNGASGASFCKNFIVTINNWVVPGQDLYDRSSC